MPSVVAEQHALDPVAIVQLQQQFPCPVVCLLCRDDRRGPDRGDRRKLLAERLCEVGHLLEAFGPTIVDPSLDLRSPIPWQAVFDRPFFQGVRRVSRVSGS